MTLCCWACSRTSHFAYLGNHHVAVKRSAAVLLGRLGLGYVFPNFGDNWGTECEVGHKVTVPILTVSLYTILRSYGFGLEVYKLWQRAL